MADSALSFFDIYTFNVQFELDGKSHVGSLILKPSSYPKLKINSNSHHLHFEENRVFDQPIVCQDISTNKFYTLYGSRLQRGTILSEFIATGKSTCCAFDKLKVCLTGVSTWIERQRSNEITASEFKRGIHVEKFSVDFNYQDNDYSIENSRNVLPSVVQGTKHLIELEDSFIITKKRGGFTLEEMKKVSQEVRTLFSLLLGFPLSIKNVYVTSSTEIHKYQSFIFPSVNYEEFPLESWHQCLCDFNSVFEWGLWDSIIKNFFKIKSFRTIWNRLVPVLPHNTTRYWEFDILSVVVTLEMYCAQKSKGQGHKLAKSKHHVLKEKLLGALSEFKLEATLSEQDNELVNDVSHIINQLKNTSHPTLQHKYNFLMSDTSSHIKEAIDFSDNDFKIIKKLRDSIAHGLHYKTATSGEITTEVQIKDRLLTLLTYFVLYELGFNDAQVAQSLSFTLNPFVMNAGGNERSRDKLAGNAKFITLAQNICLDDHKPFSSIVIIYDQTVQQYTLDERLSYEVSRNWLSSGVRDVRDFVKGLLTNDACYSLEYLNKVYLSSGDEERLYHGAILLTV